MRNRSYSAALTEVETNITRHRDSASPQSRYIARYVGGVDHEKRKAEERSLLRYYGYQMGELRALFKAGFSFSQSSEEFAVWDYIFKSSPVYEAKTMALLFVRSQKKPFYLEQQKALLSWVHHVDNWAHSDELSHIYAHLLEEEYKTLKALYEQMNRSKNPWLRRQSVVGLLNYTRQRTKIPSLPWALKLVETLLDDSHYYVQKGVGWTLREVYNANPELQIAFVKKHMARISPTAWYACSENYPEMLKKKMNTLRKTTKKRKTTSLK